MESGVFWRPSSSSVKPSSPVEWVWWHLHVLPKLPQICGAAYKVLLIGSGDLRALGWVTGSTAKVSHERIMWHWERFLTTERSETAEWKRQGLAGLLGDVPLNIMTSALVGFCWLIFGLLCISESDVDALRHTRCVQAWAFQPDRWERVREAGNQQLVFWKTIPKKIRCSHLSSYWVNPDL